GRTSRSRVRPKFAIARAAVPIFSPSWGSTSTTIGPPNALHSLVWSVPAPGILSSVLRRHPLASLQKCSNPLYGALHLDTKDDCCGRPTASGREHKRPLPRHHGRAASTGWRTRALARAELSSARISGAAGLPAARSRRVGLLDAAQPDARPCPARFLRAPGIPRRTRWRGRGRARRTRRGPPAPR